MSHVIHEALTQLAREYPELYRTAERQGRRQRMALERLQDLAREKFVTRYQATRREGEEDRADV